MLFITQGHSVSFWGCAHEKTSQSDKGVPNWFHPPPPSWISKEHFQWINTKENAALAFSFTPSLVSDQQGTICMEKRVKQWRHQGSYEQRAIRLPFRRANNAINILVLVHVQNYKRARSLVRSSPHYIAFLAPFSEIFVFCFPLFALSVSSFLHSLSRSDSCILLESKLWVRSVLFL